MASNGDSKRPSLLSRVDPNELKSIRVAVRRLGITTTGPILPIERDLVNPSELDVHIKEAGLPQQDPAFCSTQDYLGEGRRPLFDRDDVLVNTVEEQNDKRVVMSNVIPYESKEVRDSRSKSRTPLPSTSKTTHDQRQSNSSRRSCSPRSRYYRRRSNSRSPSRPGPLKETRRYAPNEHRSKSKTRLPATSKSSRDRQQSGSSRRSYSPRPSHYSRRSHSRSPVRPAPLKDTRRHERKSNSPGYRKSKSPGYRRRSGSREYSHRRRSRTPLRPGEYRPSRDREYRRRRETSPHSPRHTSSAIKSVSSRYRSRSRSPRRKTREPERSRSRYSSRRSRSRSREKRHRSRSPPPYPPEHALMPYYEGAEYWIPDPMKPRFIPRFYNPYRAVPPMMMPRMPPMMMPYPPYNKPPYAYKNYNSHIRVQKVTDNTQTNNAIAATSEEVTTIATQEAVTTVTSRENTGVVISAPPTTITRTEHSEEEPPKNDEK